MGDNPVPNEGLSNAPPPAGSVAQAPAATGVAKKGRFPRLKPQAHDVPEVAAIGSLNPGEVIIYGAATLTPDEQKIVLRRPDAKGRLELKTVNPSRLTDAYKKAPQTFLSESDCKAFVKGSNAPTVRRYRWYDSLGKLFSFGGLLVAVPAIAGAIGAWATLFGVLSPAPADLNVNSMQAALAWAAEPLATLPAHPDPTAEAAVAVEFERRSIQANSCVQSLQGHHGPVPQIPNVTCQPRSSSWIQRHGGQLAAIMTGVVTLAGLGAAAWRTRFRQSP